MFCKKCGKPLDDTDVFCGSCGNPVGTPMPNPGQVLAEPSPQPPKKKKKVWLIVLFVYLGLMVVGLAVHLVDMFLINSPKNLSAKLQGHIWCSEPMSAVTVDGSTEVMVAYTIEFHNDGKATQTTYMASCPAYDEVEAKDLKVHETKTVTWSIAGDRTLTVDGQSKSCKTLFGEGKDHWYIQDGCLHIARTYYAEDKWGYSNK